MIEQVVTYALEVEMPELHLVDFAGVRKLKKLMSIISEEVPFSLNSSKLANAIGANSNMKKTMETSRPTENTFLR